MTDSYFDDFKQFLKSEVKKGNLPDGSRYKYLSAFRKYKPKNLYARYRRLRKYTKGGITKYKCLLLYGKTGALEKWASYCNRQAYTNTKEYKMNVLGMSDYEVDCYNQSRAVTKKNLIMRYGEYLGNKKWEDYRHRQAYTNTKEYFVKKYGEIVDEQKYHNINASKAITRTNLIKKYGEYLGNEKWLNYLNNQKCIGYSKIATKLFEDLESKLGNDYTFYYEPKTREMVLNSNGTPYFYDCYIKELKLIIEFNGDVFHANPKIFNAHDNPNPFDKTLTAEEIWEADNKKVNHALDNRYKIIIIWENELRINTNLSNIIIEYIKSNNLSGLKEFI